MTCLIIWKLAPIQKNILKNPGLKGGPPKTIVKNHQLKINVLKTFLKPHDSGRTLEKIFKKPLIFNSRNRDKLIKNKI